MNAFSSKWVPVRHYSQLTSKDIVPGIYIWGFMNENNFMPYYVGKAWDVGERLCTHLSNLKGGNYTVYTWEDLFNIDHDNRFYEPRNVEDRVAFISGNNADNMDEHVSRMINNFHFTYVEMQAAEFAGHGSVAECVILNYLKNSIVNTRIGRSQVEFDKGNIEIVGDKWLKVY